MARESCVQFILVILFQFPVVILFNWGPYHWATYVSKHGYYQMVACFIDFSFSAWIEVYVVITYCVFCSNIEQISADTAPLLFNLLFYLFVCSIRISFGKQSCSCWTTTVCYLFFWCCLSRWWFMWTKLDHTSTHMRPIIIISYLSAIQIRWGLKNVI